MRMGASVMVIRTTITLIAILTGAGVSPSFAEMIRVRSGEHTGFTRIVVDVGAPSGWELGRDGSGYILRVSGLDVTFDATDVFRRITRTRLATLALDATPGVLRFGIGCACHATATADGNGNIIVDIADGPPAAGSPFESQLTPTVPPRQDKKAAEPIRTRSYPATRDRAQDVEKTIDLAPLWRGDNLSGLASRGVPDQVHGKHRQMPDTGRTDVGGSGDAKLHMYTDPSVAEAQERLLLQLSRAAAQGLVEVAPTEPRGASAHAASDDTASAADRRPKVDAHETPEPALHVETSFDRDMPSTAAHPPVSATGAACLPDANFDLAGWGDDRPAAAQIAERRRPLVGEFDHPSTEAVLSLARLYLHLGFGAEAGAVLSAFAVETSDGSTLRDIGAVLDGGVAEAGSALPALTSCDTSAALWAVLALPQLLPGTDIDEAAVLRAFSALPVHLRRLLGPGLSDRFLSVGSEQAARAVRDAVARSPQNTTESLWIIDAQLGLALGDAGAQLEKLEDLALSNGSLSTDALILAIKSRLARGLAVPTGLIESAEALAFELQDAESGEVLQHLHILARGSANDFDGSFDAYRRWISDPPNHFQRDTALKLFAMLAGHDSEPDFLAAYFANRSELYAADPDASLRLTLAERLAASGFTEEVRKLVTADAARSEQGRRLLARAATVEFDAAAAIDKLAGLRDTASETLRAEALAMAGDHAAAARAYVSAGDAEAAGRELWRAGDFSGAAANPPEPLRAALNALHAAGFGSAGEAGLSAEPVSDSVQELALPGPLARGKALVEQSRAARSAIESMIAATSDAGSR
ncbi:hypothetical protein OM960_10570 [Defluviimonas sp. CAU 1641]|uniref:Uncharacterized protein n=2 Tax=Defluviimonas salinarum TaxID=2992147 RepID=A0ABT3J2X8_9RHOB|nr:hypothetical protein [Defluviimonas salinarum]